MFCEIVLNTDITSSYSEKMSENENINIFGNMGDNHGSRQCILFIYFPTIVSLVIFSVCQQAKVGNCYKSHTSISSQRSRDTTLQCCSNLVCVQVTCFLLRENTPNGIKLIVGRYQHYSADVLISSVHDVTLGIPGKKHNVMCLTSQNRPR